MSDKFQLLLKQIRFPEEHDAFKEIKDGSIEIVKLFKSKRQWFFVFSFPTFLLARIFKMAAIEVSEIRDNNYLFGLFAAMASIISIIVAIVALLK